MNSEKTGIFEEIAIELPKIAGWCTIEKANKLINIILEYKPEICVEIGVFGGSSFIPQVMALKQVGFGKAYGIDPWAVDAALEYMVEKANIEWWNQLKMEEIFQQCIIHISRLELQDYCELIRGKSSDVYNNWEDNSIGLLHIDGNHSEPTSFGDAELYFPKVKKGGFIFFDDVYWQENGLRTTHKALKFLLDNGCKQIDGTSDWIVLKKE